MAQQNEHIVRSCMEKVLALRREREEKELQVSTGAFSTEMSGSTHRPSRTVESYMVIYGNLNCAAALPFPFDDRITV